MTPDKLGVILMARGLASSLSGREDLHEEFLCLAVLQDVQAWLLPDVVQFDLRTWMFGRRSLGLIGRQIRQDVPSACVAMAVGHS